MPLPTSPIETALVAVVSHAVDTALERHARPIQREALKVREAAEALGVSEPTIRRLIATGEIPAKKCGNPGVTIVPLAGLRSWLTKADVRAGRC